MKSLQAYSPWVTQWRSGNLIQFWTNFLHWLQVSTKQFEILECMESNQLHTIKNCQKSLCNSENNSTLQFTTSYLVKYNNLIPLMVKKLTNFELYLCTLKSLYFSYGITNNSSKSLCRNVQSSNEHASDSIFLLF